MSALRAQNEEMRLRASIVASLDLNHIQYPQSHLIIYSFPFLISHFSFLIPNFSFLISHS